jgi:HTH-type transcriptional regulator / antitoxin MqsA
MNCPSCTVAELVHDTRDMSYPYKGEMHVISGVTGDFCPACGESVLDAAESVRVSSVMREVGGR